MRACTLLGLVSALVVLLTVVGCSTPGSEPVYTEVPGVSSPAPTAASGSATQDQASVDAEGSDPAGAAAEGPSGSAAEKPELIVTPDDTLTGKVISVNEIGRFVVLRFPLGRLPQQDSTLFVYRQGLKVAELKVTGPQKDDHTVADIRTGECRVDDEVRNR
jgi:hypothetical protein